MAMHSLMLQLTWSCPLLLLSQSVKLVGYDEAMFICLRHAQKIKAHCCSSILSNWIHIKNLLSQHVRKQSRGLCQRSASDVVLVCDPHTLGLPILLCGASFLQVVGLNLKRLGRVRRSGSIPRAVLCALWRLSLRLSGACILLDLPSFVCGTFF